MVTVRDSSLKAADNTIEPALWIEVTQEMEETSILLGVSGIARSDDGKFLGKLIELPSEREEAYIKVRYPGEDIGSKHSHVMHFFIPLDKRSLDHVEERRFKNPRHEVVLKLQFSIATLHHNVRIGSYTRKRNGDDEIIVTEPKHAWRADDNYRMLIPTSDQVFVHTKYREDHEIAINESRWNRDFQKQLGIGEFLLVEIPKLTLDDATVVKLTSEEKKLKERLDKSYETLESMERHLREGEWGEVVEDLRDIELFKEDLTRFIKELVSETTNISTEKAGDLTFAISKLKDYASDLHHPIDQGKVKTVFTGGKEDAYMAYMLLASVINVLTRKLRQKVNSNTSRSK